MTDVTQSKPPQGELRYVTLADIEPAEDNLRATLAGIDDLAQSIVNSGLHTALELTTNGHDRFKIVSGHRRYAALSQAVAAGLLAASYPIPALIQTAMEDAARIEAMLVENLQRQDLNPIEEAKGFQRLVDEFGWDQYQVAAKVGVNQSNVSRRLTLLSLPEDVQKGVARGELSIEVGVALAKVGDAEAISELWDRMGSNIRQHDIDRAVDRVKTAVRIAKLQAECDKLGVRTVSAAELTGSYRYTGESFAKAKEGKGWQDEHNPDGEGDAWLVIKVGDNGKPELRVFAPQAKVVKDTANDPEKRRQKVERLTTKFYLEAVEGLVAKASKTPMVDLAFDVVLGQVTYSNAREVGMALGLEPLKVMDKRIDYTSGEVKVTEKSDWAATVLAWAEGSDKQRLQTVMATLVTVFKYREPVKAFLAQHGIDTDAIRQRAQDVVDGKSQG